MEMQTPKSNDAEALNELGEALVASQRYDEAVACFTGAIELNPVFADAYQNRGRLYSRLDRRQEALADLNHARIYTVKLAGEFGEYDENTAPAPGSGIDDVIAAIRLAEAYYQRGEIFLAKALGRRAARDFTRAIELNPGYVAAFIGRGRAWLQKGEYDQALADFNAAIEQVPQSEVGYFERGEAYLAKNDLEKAVLDFTRVITINPSHCDAFIRRGEAYSRLGRITSAAADFNKMRSLEASPESSSACTVGSKYEGEIDDLLGELMGSFAEAVADPVSKLNQSVSVVLEFLNGVVQENFVAGPFSPSAKDLSVCSAAGVVVQVVPFSDLACVRMAEKPPTLMAYSGSIHAETIEMVNGRSFLARVPTEIELEYGFYGIAGNDPGDFKYCFFPAVNVRFRCQRRFLGEILVEQEKISRMDFEQALNMFEAQKKKKLGELLAEQTNILKNLVEREIKRAYAELPEGRQLRTGEILVRAGLVGEDQVRAALEYQQALKNKRIGTYLMENKFIREGDLTTALAEKFRLPCVNLRAMKISRKAVQAMSRESALGLKALPLSFEGSELVVAIMEPDMPGIREAIQANSHCRPKLVLARSSHIKAILDKIYS